MSHTLALARLWTYMQAMPGGFAFERDVVIHSMRVAMCCTRSRVVVDVACVGSDATDRALARLGYRVLRFSTVAIMSQMDQVCEDVVTACRSRRPRRVVVLRRSSVAAPAADSMSEMPHTPYLRRT
jgi:very-short-patch-repair endonuclease